MMVKSPTWRALIGLLSGVILDTLLRFRELLNQVWGLEGCPLKGQLMLTNRSVRFGFCVATVLVACRGVQVSFNTTVGVLGA